MPSLSQPYYDVAVVGAGLAGSCVATALVRRGWKVLLIERDRLPRHKVCGEFLSPEAQHSLRRLAVYDDVAALAPVPLHTATLTTSCGRTITMPLPGQAWGLSRYALDAALAESACRHGVELWQAATVTACSRHTNHYRLRLRRRAGPRNVRARTVIMACGRHSWSGLPPRAPAAEKPLAGWRRCVGLKCHYEQVEMPQQVDLFLFSGGYVGINPIEGGRANVCMLITYEAFERWGKSVTGAIAAAAARHEGLASRLARAQPITDTICAVAPVDTHRVARPWDGMACLGDTAVMIPPLAGDGMAMAIRSAELSVPLADAFLRGSLTLDGWETAYSQAWQSEFSRRLRVGRLLQRLLATPLVGEMVVGLGRHLPGLADYLVRATRGEVLAQPSAGLRTS